MPAIQKSETAQFPLFVEVQDEFWEFRGETFEQHVECWQIVDGQVQKDKWKLSSVAASLETKYNDKTVDRFAHETRRSARRIREYAQTYRAFQNGARAPILSFSHHVKASSAPDPALAIQKAHDGEWSVHELEHWIRTGEEPGQKKKPKLTLSPELQKIHDDAVRAELDKRIAVVKGWTEPVDPILATVYNRVEEVLKWQRDRTVDRDCAAIITMLVGDEGDEDGAECASVGDMNVWLKTRCMIMSEQDVRTRVELMEKVKMIQQLSRDKSKGKTQRGVVTPVYEVHPEYFDRMADADDRNEAHPTASELLAEMEESQPTAA